MLQAYQLAFCRLLLLLAVKGALTHFDDLSVLLCTTPACSCAASPAWPVVLWACCWGSCKAPAARCCCLLPPVCASWHWRLELQRFWQVRAGPGVHLLGICLFVGSCRGRYVVGQA